ncbi:MAG: metallophosphoesterase, partial [Bacillota bacterium]|nr:metallophosphoesterase [Bacillota bacterium]
MIYAISDLHLSGSVNKPMDIFGGRWENHAEKIYENWNKKVKNDDTVILPGDLSWGLTLEETLPDFIFLDRLPGKKIISKGNHDYFWSTVSKIKEFFVQNGITTIELMHNNAFSIENLVICGSKGYSFDSDAAREHNDRLMK